MESKAAQTVSKLLKEIASVHERPSAPDIDQRTAAWWWGSPDEALGYAIGVASSIAREPVACSLYLAYAAEDTSQFRRIKDWGYGVAAEWASGRTDGPRRRVRVEGYRPEWGRVAARDGLARALWPNLVDEIPGINARCKVFGVGAAPFQRVRDEVERRAATVRQDFRGDLSALVAGRINRDMADRMPALNRNGWDGPDAILGGQWGNEIRKLAEGCERIKPARTDLDTQDRRDPETIHHGQRPTDWWSEGQALLTRVTCPARDVSPATDKDRPASDG